MRLPCVAPSLALSFALRRYPACCACPAALYEAVHVSGYTFERACKALEWLLEEERWQTVGGGFKDIDAFLDTIDFSAFKLAIDQRKSIAKKLNDLRATQRAIGKATGVGQKTVSRDIEFESNDSKSKTGGKQKQAVTKTVESNDSKPPVSITQSGEEVAKAADRAANNKEKKAERQAPHHFPHRAGYVLTRTWDPAFFAPYQP